MKSNILLRKTCSIHASDMHFATVIYSFLSKEIAQNTTIKTILERDERENIEKIAKNVGLNSEIKEKIKLLDWNKTDITKIKRILKSMEEDIKNKEKINLIILGSNLFIEKINKIIDLWVQTNMDKIEQKQVQINIINCYSFEENSKIDNILNSHEYILKTTGIEKILEENQLLKAN